MYVSTQSFHHKTYVNSTHTWVFLKNATWAQHSSIWGNSNKRPFTQQDKLRKHNSLILSVKPTKPSPHTLNSSHTTVTNPVIYPFCRGQWCDGNRHRYNLVRDRSCAARTQSDFVLSLSMRESSIEGALHVWIGPTWILAIRLHALALGGPPIIECHGEWALVPLP